MKIRYETMKLIRSFLYVLFAELNKFHLFGYGFDLFQSDIQARTIFLFLIIKIYENRYENTITVNRSVLTHADSSTVHWYD